MATLFIQSLGASLRIHTIGTYLWYPTYVRYVVHIHPFVIGYESITLSIRVSQNLSQYFSTNNCTVRAISQLIFCEIFVRARGYKSKKVQQNDEKMK